MQFSLYQGRWGEYRWRLLSDDGEVIAASEEGYADKGECKNAVRRFKAGVLGAALFDESDVPPTRLRLVPGN